MKNGVNVTEKSLEFQGCTTKRYGSGVAVGLWRGWDEVCGFGVRLTFVLDADRVACVHALCHPAVTQRSAASRWELARCDPHPAWPWANP